MNTWGRSGRVLTQSFCSSGAPRCGTRLVCGCVHLLGSSPTPCYWGLWRPPPVGMVGPQTPCYWDFWKLPPIGIVSPQTPCYWDLQRPPHTAIQEPIRSHLIRTEYAPSAEDFAKVLGTLCQGLGTNISFFNYKSQYRKLQVIFFHFQKSNTLSEVKICYRKGYSKGCAQIPKLSLRLHATCIHVCMYVCVYVWHLVKP